MQILERILCMGKVIESVASAGKMSSYRFLGTPVHNVVSVSGGCDGGSAFHPHIVCGTACIQ